MPFERTASRVWKKLSREERTLAARHFWEEPPPEAAGSALAAIIKARHLRPQVARAMAPEAQAQALASVLDPGETVAASLLVALHLKERRPLLVAFLDALGLPHEEGLLKEEDDGKPPSEALVKKGVAALTAGFPREQAETYLNTLWLQDPERWAVLEKAQEWLG